MNKRKELIALLQNDSFNLLDNEGSKKALSAKESALVLSFEEIQNFVEEHTREPASNLTNPTEFKLYSRLKAIRQDASKVKALRKYDFAGLLQGKEIKELTLEDIISDDELGLLKGDEDTEIYNLKHVKPIERIMPDYLSRRTFCKDFALYKDMFATLHEELASKKKRLVKYESSDLTIGQFYALGGILLYLKSVDGKVDAHKYRSGTRARFDGRTACIFANGTQSDMNFRSLDKAMQLDGYGVSDFKELVSDEPKIIQSDILNGYIYVLKSHNPAVKNIHNMYKIGHTTSSVAERIKSAKNEPTYLYDNVDVVATFRCFNVKSFNVEQKIHDFFSSVKLDIELRDNRGDVYTPKEWFRVNLNVINDAINLLVNNELSGFIYDEQVQQIIKRSTQ